MDKLLKFRVLIVITVIAMVISTAGLVYAALSMNQTVGLNITVNPPSGIASQASIYQDSALTQVLGQLNFAYNQGESASITTYVKANEVLTVPAVSNTIPGFTINATFGNTNGNVQELVITASGGATSATPYIGTATFTASGS